MKTNVAIVTGGSSGIGRETAKALRDRGCTVYEFSRHDALTEGVKHVQCDVSDEAQFAAAVQQVTDAEGRIDILVNNAGFGISGAAEFTDNAQAKKLLDVNVFGMVNGCKAVLPGDIRTGFTAAREKNPVGDDVYGGRIAKSVAVMEHDEQTGMDPAVAGRYIAKLALKKSVKPEYAIGFKYKFLCLLAKLLPCGLRNRIIGMLYAQ